jgi:hypothetical protein
VWVSRGQEPGATGAGVVGHVGCKAGGGLLLGYGLLAMRGSGRGFSGWLDVRGRSVAHVLVSGCRVSGFRVSQYGVMVV